MEWVETTGRTVEEATELALDQLGVDESDADVEVLEEPRSGLFGRTRGHARVRARVKPKGARPKQERRRRAGRSGDKGGGQGASSDRSRNGKGAERTAKEVPAEPAMTATESAEPEGRQSTRSKDRNRPAKERTQMDDQAQTTCVEEFLVGLADAMGVAVTATATVEDGTLRAELSGDELGRLVGPKLATLEAVQEIARNVLQREAGDQEHAKVVLDVAGVRELRRSALVTFVTEAAERARNEDTDVALEVMSSMDRKVVHDTVADLDGVTSISEGEDPRRRVVIRPA